MYPVRCTIPFAGVSVASMASSAAVEGQAKARLCLRQRSHASDNQDHGAELVFVLSRKVGESVIFDNAVIATVTVIGAGFVDLSLAKTDGTRLGNSTLDVKQLRPVVQGVAGVMVKRLEVNRVLLGFECDEGVSVARSAP